MKKLLLISIGLCLFFNANAQEVSKQRVFSFSDFKGGLATKLSDQAMTQEYARVAENIRLNTALKAISKRNQLYLFGTADATEPITGGHRLYLSDGTKQFIVTHGDELEKANDATGAFTSILALTSGDYRWQFITWHNLAIGGDGHNYSVKYDGTTPTYLGSCSAADAGSGAGPNGTYTYKVTFYTASYEVLFNVPSNSVTVTDNDISLTQIPIGPDTFLGEDVIGRKVYRIANGGATWKLLSNGTIANNTATTLTDSDADGVLSTNYPTGTATWTPPKCKYWIVHNNRLFGAGDPDNPSRLYYSKDGSHDLFESTVDYKNIRLNDGDEITFILNLLGILTVGKTNSISKVYDDGDPDDDWSISEPFSYIGCDAPYSAVNTPLGIFYLSRAKSGLYVFNGQTSTLKSDLVTAEVQDISSSNLTSVSGHCNNNVYYLAYPSKAVGGSQNNRLLIYDMILNAYTVDTVNISTLFSFDSGSDGGLLYGGGSNSGKIYSFGINSQEITHSKHSDFTGTFTNARYIPATSAAGGDPNSPILELSRTATIDELVGTINAQTGDINRVEVTGSYISPVLNTPNISTYDKIYWNETLPAGTDVTLAIRGGTTSASCAAAAWSGEFTDPSGSDVSGETAYEYTQYRISMSTGDIDYTPNVIKTGGFNVRLGYNTVGTAAETAIALHWQTGYLDFGIPSYKKTLRKLVVNYNSDSAGTLTFAFTTEAGDTDSFSIDMSTYDSSYTEYFTNGALTGESFKLDITNSDLNAIEIKNISIIYDVEPLI